MVQRQSCILYLSLVPLSLVQSFALSPNLICSLFRAKAPSPVPASALHSKWDNLIDEDDEPYVPIDMKYVPRNVVKQHQTFCDIRDIGGVELTNDVYVREPGSQIFWFTGKVARVSDVSLEECVARQWPLIERHAANLRPIELSPKRGTLEIWTAPGDSELDVAYNRPGLAMAKMNRDVPGADRINKIAVGFQGEVYDQGEEGFRTWRTEDGRAARPEVIAGEGQGDAPNQAEIDSLLKQMEGMDVSELYKEQERREGRQVEE